MPKSKKKQDHETVEKNADLLYERRNMLDSARMKHSDSLDKYLLTFATGSLYLSISFTSSLDEELISKCLLSVGWIMLIVSIVAILISFYCGEKAHTRQIVINDDCIKALYDEEIEVDETNNWHTAIEILKIISISGFILGILFLAYFYFINLK